MKKNYMQPFKVRLNQGSKLTELYVEMNTWLTLLFQQFLELGMSIPEDISVMGFDNLRLSRFISPRLTSMEIDRRQIGSKVIEMIDSLIEGEIIEDVYLKTKLMIRSSR